MPQSGAVVLASLRELLAYAAVEPPYVLVGHSLGGLFANLFARLHPKEVAAVLFLEATHPRDQEVLKPHERQLTRALGKLLALPPWRFRDNLHAEIEWVGQTVREIEAAGPFPPVPVCVLTGGNNPPKWLVSPVAAQARHAHQRELAALSPRSEHLIAGRSGHFPQLTQPQLVLNLLGRSIEKIRSP